MTVLKTLWITRSKVLRTRTTLSVIYQLFKYVICKCVKRCETIPTWVPRVARAYLYHVYVWPPPSEVVENSTFITNVSAVQTLYRVWWQFIKIPNFQSPTQCATEVIVHYTNITTICYTYISEQKLHDRPQTYGVYTIDDKYHIGELNIIR